MILLPIVALVLGIAMALVAQVGAVPGLTGQYLAVACLAGLDTLCGGVRSGLEGTFRQDVFYSGFVSNVTIAFALAWLGDNIYINLFLVVAIVLGTRIYGNLALIRRWFVNKAKDDKERRRMQRAVVAGTTEAGA